MDNIDRELLYMLLEAEKTGEPVSTWELAGSKTSNPTERNVLDGLYRYHLRRLAEQGFVIEEKTTRGKQKITYYRINPKKILCVNGSLFLLVNPIMIYECISGDTLIPFPNGKIKYVKEINPNQPGEIFSARINGVLKRAGSKVRSVLEVDNYQKVVYKGLRPVFKLKTRYFEIEATHDHLFFVRSNNPKDGGKATWKPLCKINVGEKILGVRKLPFTPTVNPPLSVEQSQCIGCYVGDGWFDGKYNVGIAAESSQAEEYANLFAASFNVTPHERRDGFVITSKQLANLIKTLGLNVKSPYRDIPDVICQAPLSHQIAFISGLLDTDGSVIIQHGVRISFFSTSLRLIQKLQLILLRFGILSSMQYRDLTGKPMITKNGEVIGHTRRPDYTLNVCGINALKLARLLTPLNIEKRRRLNELVEHYPHPYYNLNSKGVTPVNENLAFFKVVEIKPSGVKPVYDVIQTTNQNFIAAGIVAHNCPYANECNACNKPIKFYKTKKGQLRVRGCRLLAEAPDHVKETVYKHLSGE